MDWTWLVLIVGLMFVMHRFGMGCCGGHGHDHGGHGEHHKGEEKQGGTPQLTEKSKKEEVVDASPKVDEQRIG